MSEPTTYPLHWPEGWRRTPAGDRAFGRFGRVQRHESGWASKADLTVSLACDRVLDVLEKMSVRDVIVSTNVRPTLSGRPRSGQGEPDDPAVAVYWVTAGGDRRCMAIDRYVRVADNLAAVAATLDAMRAIERHGGAEILDRAFTGFAALPHGSDNEPWWMVLGLPSRDVSREQVAEAYRRLAAHHHPDRGGSVAAMVRINLARDQGLALVQARSTG